MVDIFYMFVEITSNAYDINSIWYQIPVTVSLKKWKTVHFGMFCDSMPYNKYKN